MEGRCSRTQKWANNGHHKGKSRANFNLTLGICSAHIRVSSGFASRLILSDSLDPLADFFQRRRAFERSLKSPLVSEFMANRLIAGEGIVLRITCPCCGYPSSDERANYDICSLCGWEDDGQDDNEFAPFPSYYSPDAVAGGPNADYSLTEARLNFSQYHQMYRPFDKRAFNRTNKDRSLREVLMAIYSELLPAVDEREFLRTLPRIEAAFSSIDRALSRRLRED